MSLGTATHRGLASVSSTQTQTPRVCVVSENMNLNPDEGIRKFARSLLEALSLRGPALGVSVGAPVSDGNIVSARANQLFLSRSLRAEVRRFKPDVLCYVPTASDTIFSLLRLRLLSSMCGHPATALVSLQPRPHSTLGGKLLRLMRPDLFFVQSEARALRLARVTGREVHCLTGGVDLDRFRPVSQIEKSNLRQKYGLPEHDYLVLHVGHITPERNIALLEQVQRRAQVVMVTGNSVGEDRQLRRRLEQCGVIVFDQYIEAIEEIYQAADCFIFPVSSEKGSIEMPLSVLEAMACNLPAVCTRFGALNELLPNGRTGDATGLLLGRAPEDLLKLVDRARAIGLPRTRGLVEGMSWGSVAGQLVDKADFISREGASRQ